MNNQQDKSLSINVKQTDNFKFTEENHLEIDRILSQYPKEKKASAVMPLLHLAQHQNDGLISNSAINCIAEILGIPCMQVYEVAKFYSMYNLSPVGKYCIQICRTTTCWLCGSEKLLEECKKILNISLNDTTQDNLFTLKEIECLGACNNAPVIQINEHYYENLTPEKITAIIDNLKKRYIP